MSHNYGQPQPYAPPPEDPRATEQRERTGMFRAGKVAIWVWVAVTLVPVVLVLACCGLCGFGGVVGSVTGVEPSPTGY